MNNTMHKEKEMEIYCDDCGCILYSNILKKSRIIEEQQQIKIGNKDFTLVYFTCPKCNKIYKISLQDNKYRELLEDLEKIKKRIRRNSGRNNLAFQAQLVIMADIKLKRLRDYVSALNAKYSGTFTYDTSENNGEEKNIIYLP